MAVLERAVEASKAYGGIKMLVYGPAGAGKTTLARTMPKPVLVLDFEGGVLALLGEPEVLVCPIQSTDDLLEACRELVTDTKFRSVVFDGFSLFVRRRVQELRGSKERVTWSEWQQLTSELRAAILPLLHLRKHLLLTALPRYRTENNAITHAEPALTPALRQDIIAACDLVGYIVAPSDPLFTTEDGNRVIIFASEKAATKSRIPNLSIAPADFSAILQLANLPELTPTASPVRIVPVKQKPTQQLQEVVKDKGEQSSEKTQEPEAKDDGQSLTSQVFEMARKLGMNNQALGRLAKQYFGKSFVRDLTDEQKRKLLDIMSDLAVKQAQKAQASEQQQNEQIPKPSELSELPNTEPTNAPTDDNSVEFYIAAWRNYRGYDGEFPCEKELAKIAVDNGWQFDELEAIIAEKLLDAGIDLSSIDEKPYWLVNVSSEVLQRIVEGLQA